MRRSMILLAAGALLLAACGGDESNDGSDAAADEQAAESEDGTTTITFWNGFTDADRPAVEEIVRRFNESQDEYAVDMTIQPWDVINQTLLGDVRSYRCRGVAAPK